MNKNDLTLYNKILMHGLIFITGFVLGVLSQSVIADTSTSIGTGTYKTVQFSISESFKEEAYKLQTSYWKYDSSVWAFSAMVNLFKPERPVRFYAGVSYLSNVNDVNGTNLNFVFQPEVKLTDTVSLYVTHYSNGRRLGIGPEEYKNKGWNFVGLRYHFK